MKFNAAGQPSFFAASGQYPYGPAFDAADNLYVANFGDNSIQKIDPAGNSSIFADLGMGSMRRWISRSTARGICSS